jgi:hypothetical protein
LLAEQGEDLIRAELRQLLLAIYDAAFASSKWPAALNAVARASRSMSAALISAEMATTEKYRLGSAAKRRPPSQPYCGVSGSRTPD